MCCAIATRGVTLPSQVTWGAINTQTSINKLCKRDVALQTTLVQHINYVGLADTLMPAADNKKIKTVKVAGVAKRQRSFYLSDEAICR